MQNILLTGATGMIGRPLMKALLKQGAKVSVLSRRAENIPGVKTFLWDIYKKEIDTACMEGIDTVVHLAGEPIAEKKWTKERRHQIIDSRVVSTQLLYKAMAATGNKVKNFIGASAVGYYGDRGEELLTEESPAGNGFVSECCQEWENAVDAGTYPGLRIVKIRTGVVLAKDDGGLPEMAKPIKLFAGAPLGSGKQWVPWIHHEDIEGIFLKAVMDDLLSGIFNAAAPNPVTNETLTKAIAHALHRPVWPVHVPPFLLGMVLGARKILPLMSTKTDVKKIEKAGYCFRFSTIEEALREIYLV